MHQSAFRRSTCWLIQEYKVELYNSQCWICYFCQHTCRCSKCHQPEKLALEKKSSSRKKNSVSLIAARREDITDNGQNNSDSFRGSEKSIEKNNLIYNPLFENDSKSVSKGPSQVVNYSIMEEDEIK